MITWIFGDRGIGKTTLARKIRRGEVHLDGDDMRAVWTDLGFSKADRFEQNMRVARLAKLLESQGFEVIVSTICPYEELREEIRKIIKVRFIQIT